MDRVALVTVKLNSERSWKMLETMTNYFEAAMQQAQAYIDEEVIKNVNFFHRGNTIWVHCPDVNPADFRMLCEDIVQVSQFHDVIDSVSIVEFEETERYMDVRCSCGDSAVEQAEEILKGGENNDTSGSD